MSRKTTYCAGCGRRLNQEMDRAFWKRDFRCLLCSLDAAFVRHGLPPLSRKVGSDWKNREELEAILRKKEAAHA